MVQKLKWLNLFQILMFILVVNSNKIVVDNDPITNVQQRLLYYSEQDNVCSYGEQSDKFKINVEFNDRESIAGIVNGGTTCLNLTVKSNALVPATSAIYKNCRNGSDCDTLQFFQKPIYVRIHGAIMNIIQEYQTTGSGMFDGNWYRCVIIGSGKPSHFGPTSQNPQIPQARVRCYRFDPGQTEQ